VFSTPGEGVSDEEFDRWYDEHLDEILSSADRKADGDTGPQLPAWWDEVRFHSFNCIAVGERRDA
jgi:hypothetical protein